MSASSSQKRNALHVLVDRLPDERGRRVVFLSHCLLNENTRYLGGACRTCCVREVIEQCMDQGVGMVQMPCPEQQVWGGVLKRRMLRLYGARRTSRVADSLIRALLPIGLLYVRRAYRRMARVVAAQIEDYLTSGFTVLGIVGIDGSPTCGVHETVAINGFVQDMVRVEPAVFSRTEQNSLVRAHVTKGRGIFIDELERELHRRHLKVPLLAHDLLDELEGLTSKVAIDGEERPRE
jgi:predicted secreted protein